MLRVIINYKIKVEETKSFSKYWTFWLFGLFRVLWVSRWFECARARAHPLVKMLRDYETEMSKEMAEKAKMKNQF